ncbi:MAG: hypothetical protein LBB42_02610 [Coriobacteriales bacterium]|jgi:hypothetical protein|nr:hypothetical protein [Coriobacteriales bacterium]
MKKQKLIAVLITLCCTLSLMLTLAACDNASAPDVPSGTAASEDGHSGDNPADTVDTSNVNLENYKITLIGDSVILGGIEEAQEAIPGINILARTDRQLADEGIKVLKDEVINGTLGDIVVLAVGTSFVARDDIDNAMKIIGPGRQVVFVTAYRGNEQYIDGVNAAIQGAAEAYSANAVVADWHAYVLAHPDIKLAADDCHLTETSAVEYANVIKNAALVAATRLEA